jgi:hypothetical protein
MVNVDPTAVPPRTLGVRMSVVNDGDVPNTSAPDPVSSVTAEARLALEGVPRNVSIPVAVVVVEGATPAPPPIIKALAAKAEDEAHAEALLKYGIPPDVPATVRASVPDVVIGDPATDMRPPVKVCATLVTPVPDGVAQVPSPRQKVEPLADVPELRLATGRLPVTSADSDTAPNVGAPAALPCRTVVVVPSEAIGVGVAPAPPPRTSALAVRAIEDASVPDAV